MKVFKRPAEFHLTDRKAHAQVWMGHSLTACGKHVQFTDGRLMYEGNSPTVLAHPICCKACIRSLSKEAS